MSDESLEFTIPTDAGSLESSIWLNGERLTNEQVQIRLCRGAEAERIVKEIREAFYGQNLQVANWHLNGDLEPIDEFFEEHDWVLDED